MKLKLDKKIESLSDIFNFSDVEKAKQFIEQKGYFTNNIYFLENIQQLCQYGTLTYVYSTAFAYNTFRRKEDGAYYEYFIPESFLKPKEKKFRPYTIEEFQKIFTLGKAIKFRRKDDKEHHVNLVFLGYTWLNDRIAVEIGHEKYFLDVLLNDFEWFNEYNDEYTPFGVAV